MPDLWSVKPAEIERAATFIMHERGASYCKVERLTSGLLVRVRAHLNGINQTVVLSSDVIQNWLWRDAHPPRVAVARSATFHSRYVD